MSIPLVVLGSMLAQALGQVGGQGLGWGMGALGEKLGARGSEQWKRSNLQKDVAQLNLLREQALGQQQQQPGQEGVAATMPTVLPPVEQQAGPESPWPGSYYMPGETSPEAGAAAPTMPSPAMRQDPGVAPGIGRGLYPVSITRDASGNLVGIVTQQEPMPERQKYKPHTIRVGENEYTVLVGEWGNVEAFPGVYEGVDPSQGGAAFRPKEPPEKKWVKGRRGSEDVWGTYDPATNEFTEKMRGQAFRPPEGGSEIDQEWRKMLTLQRLVGVINSTVDPMATSEDVREVLTSFEVAAGAGEDPLSALLSALSQKYPVQASKANFVQRFLDALPPELSRALTSPMNPQRLVPGKAAPAPSPRGRKAAPPAASDFD